VVLNSPHQIYFCLVLIYLKGSIIAQAIKHLTLAMGISRPIDNEKVLWKRL
jgi:hypothetical protein